MLKVEGKNDSSYIQNLSHFKLDLAQSNMTRSEYEFIRTLVSIRSSAACEEYRMTA